MALLRLVLFGLFEAMHNSTTTVMLIELFPAHMRTTGSAIGYNLGAALVAGPGPLIAAALAATGHGRALPAVYIAGVALICTAVLWRMLPETRERGLGLEGDHSVRPPTTPKQNISVPS
ncbi:hypothetical protein [Nocardia sp. NBC_00416]|uniref:hypothetical protein n=1 Tax=Nocardia sp. NBC_00416 TaxID=2975991 RepID=UPI002E2148A5